MTTQAENAIRETAWHYRENEFTTGGLTYAFVRPMHERANDYIMVRYPEGGLGIVAERWDKSLRRFRYNIGGVNMLKSEIISRFGLEPVVNPSAQVVPLHTVKEPYDRVIDMLDELVSTHGMKFLVTQAKLAKAAQLTVPTLRKYLRQLETANHIEVEGCLQGTWITVKDAS
ncbi:hypothetical protein [Mycobacteroides abscessus]|uniref:hypothetical protein n=3 Tax=Mycobacteroides abscessus TaxID=36809 RepID=UPI0009265BB3|nr:hypothetical protein [Mycobacteroides abscessus]SIG00899.1 Uncharacterised protein [Mycobacteroides abscessus subsp. abscessus]SKW94518.1 Uncharacterised protein [Mycobacteroides abscessus subsp. abscessus]SKX63664.1 Uncharacterised protein [Mycobacteroides abscessus subsp. abscessus]SKZ15939.1 Uncharacterised protein [Mycobacteroides abscessus subsp. abscessus]SKZ31711.1 Uncharacterised protein [Mycobacteroides abscessus subsp. abscessus]